MNIKQIKMNGHGESEGDNYTRRKGHHKCVGDNHTSLVFTMSEEVGALSKALRIFEVNNCHTLQPYSNSMIIMRRQIYEERVGAN